MTAYHAALTLCSVLLYAQGYRPQKEREHYRTIKAMPLILGSDRIQDAKYLDDCRMKRNVAQRQPCEGFEPSQGLKPRLLRRSSFHEALQ